MMLSWCLVSGDGYRHGRGGRRLRHGGGPLDRHGRGGLLQPVPDAPAADAHGGPHGDGAATVAVAPTTSPPDGDPHATEAPGPGALLLVALGAVLTGRWLWRSGRLPVWDLERAALWLPWRREEAAAWWRCRWQGRDWLVRGVLPDAFWQRPRWWPLLGARRRAYLAVLAGEEGSGKSYLLTYLAVCLVLGLDWLGVPVRRLRAVVYADSELDAQTFWQRVGAIVAGLEPDDPDAALRACRRRLVYLCLADYGEDLAVPSPDAAGRGKRPAGLERIRRTVRKTGAGLVLLDGLTTGGGVAPGDQEGSTRSQNALQRLGCAVLAIDHTNDAGRLAGSRSKSRLARIIYTLRAAPGGAWRGAGADLDQGQLLPRRRPGGLRLHLPPRCHGRGAGPRHLHPRRRRLGAPGRSWGGAW